MFQMYNILGMSDKVQNWTWNGFRVYYDLASK
jgi:peptide/nickel transport system substrate-binding protein